MVLAKKICRFGTKLAARVIAVTIARIALTASETTAPAVRSPGRSDSRTNARPTTYEQTSSASRPKARASRWLLVAPSAARVRAPLGVSATITDARAAIDKLVQDPEMFTSRRARRRRSDSLMAALGYALEGPGRYEFRTATTPVVLRRLALASASSRQRCEKSRR